VYERFDQYKTNIENKFVYKDMCSILHQNNSTNFSKLENRMEEGFRQVDAKLTELQQMFVKQLSK